ncbi:MAG: alpha/beta fold hydrolase [Thermoguttaceae bacterium]
MDRARVYSEAGSQLARHGWLYVTLDPPCHGHDHRANEPENLPGWAHRVKTGEDLTGPFVKRCIDVLDFLVKQGYTDPQRVAACGTSRGGFCALHFAAAEPRVRAVAGVSPVTNLLVLREFNGMTEAQVRSLNVAHLAEKLAGRAVWLSIGDNDQRVGTEDCTATARQLTAAARRRHPDAETVPVELVVGPSDGHSPVKNAYSRAARFVLRQLPSRGEGGRTPSGAEKLVPVGLQKQLFVDDYIVAEKNHVTREAGQAKKYGVVMVPTLPTEFQSGKVHDGPDGGYGFESHFCWFWSPYWNTEKKIFQMWYMGSNRPHTGLCYAESKDGVNWTKPKISKDGKTNLVNWNSPVPILRHKKSMDLFDTGINGVTVTNDPSLPYGSAEKYKVAFYPMFGGSECTTRLGYSADGIYWNLYNKGHGVTGRAADTNNQIHWNPLTKRYLLHCRQDFKGGGGIGEHRGVRIMEHTKGNDLINHPTAWKTLTTFALDDPDKTVIPGTKTPLYQIHTFPMWYYEGVWFGLTDVLAATNKHVPDGEQDYHKRHKRGVWEFYMAPSRDAVNYDFAAATYPRKALIPRGPAGSFDKDCVRPPSNIVTHNDQHWIYYLATNERWGCHRWDARLALAKLRLDGFFFLEAKEKPGTVVTKPFKLEGDKLQLNVDAVSGYVKVELLDKSGKPILGFSGDAAKTYRGFDKLRLEPKWKDQADLSSLEGKEVRLRFTMENAKLYAFQIQ